MKKVEVLIKPFTLEAITAALKEADIEGVTISEVKSAKDPSQSQTEYEDEYIARIDISAVVHNDDVIPICNIIQTAANEAGDKGILNFRHQTVESAIRVRTEEQISDDNIARVDGGWTR